MEDSEGVYGRQSILNLNEYPEGPYEEENDNRDHGGEENVDNFDIALDQFCVDDIESDEVMKMIFPSESYAELFYNTYARAIGFSIRKSDFKMFNREIVKYRKWVCSCEGERDPRWKNLQNRRRDAKPNFRTNCEACFRIKYKSNEEVYVVTKFHKEHNHPLASRSTVQFLRSHRAVDDADYALARSLRRVGVGASQIMKFFVLQAGGYSNLRFLLKDLYNKMEAERRKEIVDGDAECAVAFLVGKQANDPMFYYLYQLDDKSRLRTLFWADSRSRDDYRLFGDVLIFDSTYKTNEYHKPLVILAGVNNHFQTCIFACALMSEETADNYIWIIQTFLSAMSGKKPVSVLTDGDKSIRKAIKTILPEANHRLCSWHFQQNAKTGVKNCDEFFEGLHRCVYANYTEERFELEWRKLVEECALQDNEWVKIAYRRRRLWAHAYLRGKFFAGMRSTQRSEKMNDVMKIYLDDGMKLFEFVNGHEMGTAWLRHQECKAHSDTENSTVMMTTAFLDLEKHAMEFYTRCMFFKVREEITKSSVYNPDRSGSFGNHTVYLLNKYGSPGSTWRAEMNRETLEIKCSCMSFDNTGIPCAHMFRIMVYEHMSQIPDCHLLKRWGRRSNAEFEKESFGGTVIDSVTQMATYGNLASECNVMCYYASLVDDGSAARIRDFVNRETARLKELLLSKNHNIGDTTNAEASGERRLLGIKDPLVMRAKGDHISKGKSSQVHNKCGNCGSRDGHNSRTCTKRRLQMDEPEPNYEFASGEINNSSQVHFDPRYHQPEVGRGTDEWINLSLQSENGAGNCSLIGEMPSSSFMQTSSKWEGWWYQH